MKTLLCLLALAALTGCATTRINVTTPTGVKVTASFPKNMDATDLELTFDPVAQVYRFKAATLKTDAAVVVREKNVGLTAVAGAVSDAAKAATPLIK
jgi:hypothetical protein